MVKLTDATLSAAADLKIVKDDNVVKSSKRQQLERRDLDSQVHRDLTERYPLLTHIDTDVRLIDGQTMRQELREARRVSNLANKKDSPLLFGTLLE